MTNAIQIPDLDHTNKFIATRLINKNPQMSFRAMSPLEILYITSADFCSWKMLISLIEN